VAGLIEKSGGKRLIDAMKERIETVVDDVFSVLLLGLPQGLLLGVVWIAYTVRAALNTRGAVSIQSFSRLK
jgi:hypothetical protein